MGFFYIHLSYIYFSYLSCNRLGHNTIWVISKVRKQSVYVVSFMCRRTEVQTIDAIKYGHKATYATDRKRFRHKTVCNFLLGNPHTYTFWSHKHEYFFNGSGVFYLLYVVFIYIKNIYAKYLYQLSLSVTHKTSSALLGLGL